MNVMKRLNLTWTKTKPGVWVLHLKGHRPEYGSNYGFIIKNLFGYDSIIQTPVTYTGSVPYSYTHKTLAESKASLIRRIAIMYPGRRK